MFNSFSFFSIRLFLLAAVVSLNFSLLAEEKKVVQTYSTKQIEKIKTKLQGKNIPGGIVMIPLKKNVNQAYFNNKPLLIISDENKQKYVLIGLSLSLRPDRYLLITNQYPISFLVSKYSYKEQRINLKKNKQKYITPEKKDINRIIAEKKRSRKMLNYFSLKRPELLNLIPPTTGILSSPFGLRRFFNGVPKNPHNGLDFANKKGTKIYAVAAGKVLDVHDYYFNGNSVFIDHGSGLVSVYIHLSKTLVKVGQIVKQGDLIGQMGQTGRTTAPNLHFGIYLNGNAVDPKILLNLAK